MQIFTRVSAYNNILTGFVVKQKKIRVFSRKQNNPGIVNIVFDETDGHVTRMG